MWHWIQRVTPRRLTEASLPEELRHRLGVVRAEGWDPVLLDLTLDLLPVVLGVMRRPGRLSLGLACARAATAAASRALEECMMIALAPDTELTPISDPTTVQTPEDHLALHHDPVHAASHAFLFEGDSVDAREIPAPAAPLPDVVARVGETVLIEHVLPATEPFRVVRAIVPGLVPIWFGWDWDPLGMPRLARPITTLDGRAVGGSLDLRTAGPILPHPFP
jgi:ribosomal protein S12 methylthiotransferase accessory factor YcaO